MLFVCLEKITYLLLEINFNSNLWEQLFQFNLDAWYKTLFHHNWKGSWFGDKENSIFDQHHNIGRPIEKIPLTSSVKISALLWKRISDDGAGITPYRTTDVATRILLFSSTELLNLSQVRHYCIYRALRGQLQLTLWNILISADPWNILICIGLSPKKRNISIWNDPWPNEKYSPLGRSLKYSYRHRSLTKRNISISVNPWPVDNSGLHFEIPCVEHAEVVDMRTCFMKVPPQEVLSVFNLCKIFNLYKMFKL